MKRFTLPEAAEEYKTPIATLRKHLNDIGFSKLGKRIILREDDLLKWEESKRSKPTRELIAS